MNGWKTSLLFLNYQNRLIELNFFQLKNENTLKKLIKTNNFNPSLTLNLVTYS